MNRDEKRLVVVVVCIVVAAGVLAWVFWPKGPSGQAGKDGGRQPSTLAAGGRPPEPSGPPTQSAPAGEPASRTTRPEEAAPQVPKLDVDAAAQAAARGNQLLAAGKLAEGRAELSKAVLSGQLPPERGQAALKTLEDLADQMLFSGRIVDGDPYTFQYACRAGDVLAKVERALRLHVPTQILMKINGLTDAREVREGKTLKLIRGPFHAIVDKSRFTLDIYLYRPGSDPAFIRRLRVGLGKDGSTPAGLWRVALGKKLVRAPWNPPPNSEYKRRIMWGEPDYPLGAMGYWISLEGIEPATEPYQGYGIHGTNDPKSIGREESLGCIRLIDADIDLVFSVLYESWSTVRVLP